MRKRLVLLGLAAGLIFTGCRDREPVKVMTEQAGFSDEAEDWEMYVSKTIYSSSDAKVNESCAVLNREVTAFYDTLQSNFKEDAAELFASLAELAAEGAELPEWRPQLIIADKAVMATDKYISVRFEVYTFLGGAHGATSYYAYNYDVRNRRLIAVDEIIDESKKAEIDQALANNFLDLYCFTQTATLDDMSALNLSQEGLCFTYDPYVLGPYSCGHYEMAVPYDELKGCLLLKEL